MRVCRIAGDSDYIGTAIIDDDQDLMLLKADRERVPVDPGATFRFRYGFGLPSAEGVVTDCAYSVANNGLVLSSRAVDVLEPLLLESGSLHPVTLTPEVGLDDNLNPPHHMGYQMYVCTTWCDALDPERTELFQPQGSLYGPIDIQAYAFKEEALRGAGFFMADGRNNTLFATDRVMDAMLGHRLTGFRIRPVWSSTDGILARFSYPGIEFERFPPGYGSTLREKRQAMRDFIAGRR